MIESILVLIFQFLIKFTLILSLLTLSLMFRIISVMVWTVGKIDTGRLFRCKVPKSVVFSQIVQRKEFWEDQSVQNTA